VQDALTRGDRDTALALLGQVIESDPTDESRYLEAARLLGGQGRRGAARAAVGRARAVLGELRLSPPPELEALEASLTATGDGTT
jgi:DNA-binding SARP family transcriptional activator